MHGDHLAQDHEVIRCVVLEERYTKLNFLKSGVVLCFSIPFATILPSAIARYNVMAHQNKTKRTRVGSWFKLRMDRRVLVVPSPGRTR
jgi:hypothetical protein